MTVAQKLEEAIMTTILPKLIHPAADTSDNENTDKLSCHDSGIDIRDPIILQQLLPQLQQNKLPQAPPKKYSDADIVLSDDWVPPVPLVTPLGGGPSHLSAGYEPHGHDRKKASSVSFSVEEADPQGVNIDKGAADKKNKVSGWMGTTTSYTGTNPRFCLSDAEASFVSFGVGRRADW